MSATTTTVGLAKRALLDLWVAALVGSGVQVTYGNRVTVAKGERVTIGGALGETAPQSLGPGRQMRENYDIRCKVSVSQVGSIDLQQPVTDRVLEIFGVLEAAVRGLPSQNLNLGVIDVLAVVEGPWELGEAEASDTGGTINSWYEFNVRVQARFRLP